MGHLHFWITTIPGDMSHLSRGNVPCGIAHKNQAGPLPRQTNHQIPVFGHGEVRGKKGTSVSQKGLEACYCLWGVPFRPSPGSYPGPVQVPSRVRGGPVQICPCALFYSVSDPSRSRGGGHPGPSWSHPAPERFLTGSGLDGQKQTSWPLLSIPRSSANNLGEIPREMGALSPLF